MSALIHPFRETTKHTYAQVCIKVRTYFGVTDAEALFASMARDIRDQCRDDEHGIAAFGSLREYWEHRQRQAKWLGGGPVADSGESARA